MNKIEGTIVAAIRLESGKQATCGLVVRTTEEQKAEFKQWESNGLVVVERKADHDASVLGIEQLCKEIGKLRTDLAVREAEVEQHRTAHLEGGVMKYKVLKWMLSCHVGASSKAMAAHLCGFPCRGDYPRDPDDINRCVMLLDAVPEARALLPKMAEVNRYWAALVSRWDEIEAAFREERLGPVVFCSAPKTHRLMNEIINKAAKAGEEPIK